MLIRTIIRNRWCCKEVSLSVHSISACMKYGLFFSLMAAGLFSEAYIHGGWFWLMIWPALCFGNIATGYWGRGAKVFGKHPDGTLNRMLFCVNLPYLLCIWMLWYVASSLSRENPHDDLCNGILIGRLPSGNELSDSISLVVDLTAEFIERKGVLQGREDSALPILDGSIPSPDAFSDLVKNIANWNGDVYIHCAQGHGRTGLVAAAMLIAKGITNDVDEAIAIVQSRRPGVALSGRQRAS